MSTDFHDSDAFHVNTPSIKPRHEVPTPPPPAADPLIAQVKEQTDTDFVTTATISISHPTNVVDGDTLVLVIMHRDTLTTPTGWTLEFNESHESDQDISVFSKTRASGDTGSLNVTQATSQRTGASMIAFDSAVSLGSFTSRSSSETGDITFANITNPNAYNTYMLHIVDFFLTTSNPAYPCQEYAPLSRIKGTAATCRMSVHGRVFSASEVHTPYMQVSPANGDPVWSMYVPVTVD